MNQSLIKLTEEKIGNNTALASFIDKAKQQTICLFPDTVQFTDPALKFGAAIVTIDTSVDQYGNPVKTNKDIYKNESGGYCLHLSKINEISQHSGIQITDSRILDRKTDQNGRVTYIEHQVKGELKYVDGSIKKDIATGKYDYFRDVDKYIDKDGKRLDKMIANRRNHAEALAESNAKTRLYNKLNFKLPSSFTLDELKKPFLVPFIIEDKDELLKQLPQEAQDEIRKDLVRSRLGIANQIYGGQNQIEDAQIIISDPPNNNGNNGNGYKRTKQEKLPEAKQPTMTPEEQNHIIAEEFGQSTQAERTQKILDLCKIKGVKNPGDKEITAKQIESSNNPVDKQILFIEKLLNMPDADEGEGELPL